MTERLKGSVSLGRTENLGNYRSLHLQFTEEFWLDERTAEEVAEELDRRITRLLQKRQEVTA